MVIIFAGLRFPSTFEGFIQLAGDCCVRFG